MESKQLLTNQIEQLKKFLLNYGYAQNSVDFYSHCWNRLEIYANENSFKSFTAQIGREFLKSVYEVADFNYPKGSEKKPVRAIRLLEAYVETGRMAGYIKRISDVPEQFSNTYSSYVEKLHFLGQKPESLKTKKSRIRKFILYLNEKGIDNLSYLTRDDLIKFMDFLRNAYSSTGRGNILYTVKDFLQYCYDENIIQDNIHHIIKSIYTNPNETLPSVYTAVEIKTILQSVNKNTAEGKKDYAILVLAAVLGIRASDIISIKLDDIKWSRNVLEFHQRKTGFFVQLPLSENILYILMDYIKNSRPDTEYKSLFIRSRAPIVPYADSATIFSTVSKYIRLAGIKIGDRNHGPHSLRHSMASGMLENHITLPVIAAALGHNNTKNTSRYLKIDIELLRSIALEVPQ